MNEILDRHIVEQRRSSLDRARAALKAYFVGIDPIIDELCDAVLVWYVAPQLLSRPVIVNLWGMTGVGKTDLVRRVVAELDIADRFVEIELTNADSTTWHTSVAARLGESGALQGEPTLMLFDEIQRFNTLDHEGKPVTNTKFSDFWELLSDGRLARRESPELEYLSSSLKRSVRDIERKRAAGEELGVDGDRIDYWEANNLKRTLSLNTPLEQLEAMTYAEGLALVQSARATKRIYEPMDCSRCLVIVSGNLDEAFQMAGQGSEADVDADVFAAHTAKITVVDIKNALMRRFKPEQVARFGNTHLIYTSLRRVDFAELIDRETQRVIRRARESFEVELDIDDSVRDLIYRNGVFPVQGVRPVFSSVADILETNLAKLLFSALLDGHTRIGLRYDPEDHALFGVVGGETVRLPYTGRIDKIREASSPEKVANIAVHEAGHAVMYGLLFGLAPRQLTARVASTYVGGFTMPHTIYETAGTLVSQVKVNLAGGLAEELIFGDDHTSIGRDSDRESATRQLIDFVTRYGFDKEFQATYMLDRPYDMDSGPAEPDIEKMMARLVAETRSELSTHQRLVTDLARQLAQAGSLESADVAAVLNQHGLIVEVMPDGHLSIAPYCDLLG
jgi:Peptidase family M41/C-terminal, D2-small domain, of ClpB protein